MRSIEQWVVLLLIVVVFVVGSVTKLVFLDADFDPDLTSSNSRITDEGWKSANALKRTMTGDWLTEKRNWIITLPVPQLIQWVFFELLGISLKTARIPSVVMSIVAIASTIWLLLSGYFFKRGAWWSSLLFVYLVSSNYVFFGFSRLVFYELPMICFGMIAIVCANVFMDRYQARKKYLVYAVATGAFLILSMLSKTTGVVFVLTLGVSILIESYFDRRLDWRLMFATVCVGTVAVLVVYFTPQFMSIIIGEIKNSGLAFLANARGGTIRAKYFYRFFTNSIFSRVPIIHFASLLGCLLTLIQSSRNRKIQRADALMLAFYTTILLFQGAFKYQPPRYALPLVFPICYFTAILPWKISTEVAFFNQNKAVGFIFIIPIVLLVGWGNQPNIEKLYEYYSRPSFTHKNAAREIRQAVLEDSGSTRTPLYGEIPSTFVLENRMFFHLSDYTEVIERPIYLVVQEKKPIELKNFTELGVWDIVKPHFGMHLRLYRVD